MYSTGALIVESSKLLLPALVAASRVVSNVLYIPLNYDTTPPGQTLSTASQQIRRIYLEVSQTSPLLDVRILLPSPLERSLGPTTLLQYGDLDVVLSSLPNFEQVRSSAGYQLLAERVKGVGLEARYRHIKVDESPTISNEGAPAIKDYNDVVLGGTFDNIHNGHRLLLTQSALITRRRLLIGISSGALLSSKILPELIKPVPDRIADVQMFLSDIQPGIVHEVVSITDVYGPAITDEGLECVVVSPETVRGAQMINTERTLKGLRPLAVHTIEIVDRLPSGAPTLAQEAKLSSSDIRRGMMGSYRHTHTRTKPFTSEEAYLIGLTGGIASGKSTKLKRLSKKGAYAIDCDKLGHEAHCVGSMAHTKIVKTFGEGVLDDNGGINRRVLGPIVFADKMYSTGALIVESSKLLLPALVAASRVVSNVLYIPLNYDTTPPGQTLSTASQQIRQIYLEVSQTSPLLDVRILLPSPLERSLGPTTLLQYGDLDVVLSSLPNFEQVRSSAGYQLLAERVKGVGLEACYKHIKVDESPTISNEGAPAIKDYNDVVLGGTFDNIHNGHRLLLTQSALITRRRLLIGISSGALLSSKILPELIKPAPNRIADVQMFLSDIQPGIVHEVVSITDVYGPTITDEGLECIVVSPETVRGAQMINTERTLKGLRPLAVHTIEIVDRLPSGAPTLAQEAKLSSSDIRRGMIGSYRHTHTRTKPFTSEETYLIGLTGGIASGKSAILKRLSKKGAYAIDCDKLGHEAYCVGSMAHTKIVETFGEGVLDDNGGINRRVLGPIVFADKAKLEQLNLIVWPEIWSQVERRIEQAVAEGYAVCVIDAAVMLSAGWEKNMHEIWVAIAPKKDVVARIMDRDGLSEGAALSRMASQPTNDEYVQQANVVFSTQWEQDYTQKQVDKAWEELLTRIQSVNTRPANSQL